MANTFNDLFKKAQGALVSIRGQPNVFLGKDGDIIYSKNNVCVHESSNGGAGEVDEDNVVHTPGYLTVLCLNDEHLGVTLVLQWLPNATLEKNPGSIRCVSPRNRARKTEESAEKPADSQQSGPQVVVQDAAVVSSAPTGERPTHFLASELGADLGVPSINVIPNTPMDPQQRKLLDGLNEDELDALQNKTENGNRDREETASTGSGQTSGADDLSDDNGAAQSSSDEDEIDKEANRLKSLTFDSYRRTCESFLDRTPEQFAQEHNLILDSGSSQDDTNAALAMTKDRVLFQQRPAFNTSLFSVNLGKMRSMRLFFSNPEATSGQLVIASPDSQYKILHFHHGGLDKLSKLFEQWNAIKAKSVKDGCHSPLSDRHLLIFHPEVKRTELDPEDGLYDRVGWDFWKTYMNEAGSIDDSFTIRKAIYFASMDPSLRKEVWPFLLRVYPWNTTFEQRETVRNDLFLEYQNIKKRRMKKMDSNPKSCLFEVETTINKDVVRTDRKNPFFAGENNLNLSVMRDILLNYAFMYPDISYIQGMSDLLSPILATLRNEADAYWCFSGLMGQTLFCTSANADSNAMETNLEYLRELLKLLEPRFFQYLVHLGGDALQLMFVHRWLLLFFKREFPEQDALHLWEACWAMYRTRYFHLFVAVAIVSIYGPDILNQGLPNDEILLYFSSLAMHMNATVVLKKARGLLHHFYRLERIPCTLAGLCDLDSSSEQWTSHMPHHTFECTQLHGNNEPCPFATQT